jgi:Domain of unknown function (DUF4326)
VAERVQRRHPKSGYVLPAGVVDCTRPGPFGNPFRVGPTMTAEEAVTLFGRHLEAAIERRQRCEGYSVHVIGRQAGKSLRHRFDRIAAMLPDLRDKDCACYCPVSAEFCHVNVLMAAAARTTEKR